jgi:hypothetical protein
MFAKTIHPLGGGRSSWTNNAPVTWRDPSILMRMRTLDQNPSGIITRRINYSSRAGPQLFPKRQLASADPAVGAPLIIIITLSSENDVSPGAKIDPERVRPAKTFDAFARAKIIPWRGPTRPQPASSDFYF